MNILWIDLNCSYAHSSLALPALHAQLQDETEWQWHVVSATTAENAGSIVTRIIEHKPDVIAATAWLFNIESLMHICSRAKAVLPNTKIILGGPEFLGNNEHFLRSHEFIDCVFRGEGEKGFADWLRVINCKQQWNSVTGLCFIADDGTYHDNGKAQIANFATLRAPEESCFFNWGKPFVQLETTRGCFNSCTFCVSGGEKPVRNISIDEVRRRLTNIRQHGIRDVRVLDRTFNYNAHYAADLLALFAEFHPHMRFHLEIHPALLSDSLKDILRSLPDGLLHLEAGIQSLNENVLEACGRKGSIEKTLQGLNFLCSLDNTVTHADLIAGLPLYSYDEIMRDVHTLAQCCAGEIQLESLKMLPGTAIRHNADKYGLLFSPMPPYEVIQTPYISAAEMQQARRLSRLLDAYYNTEAWQEVTRDIMLAEQNFIPLFLEHLTELMLIDQPMSIEKRGLLLYKFVCEHFPEHSTLVVIAWIRAGLSLKKEPAERIQTKRITPPDKWHITKGTYTDNLKLCFLPVSNDKQQGYWFGLETETQYRKPIFEAHNIGIQPEA